MGFLSTLKKTGLPQQNHFIFQDGDFVVMHHTYAKAKAFGAKEIVAFDVIQEIPAEMAHSNGMF